MENMITKEKRIAFLMLPATMIEKFVARFLIVTVGLAVAVFVAASLAEITRYLLLPLFNVPETFHQSVLYNLLSMASVDGEQIYRGSGYAMNMPYQNWLGELCGWAFLVWSPASDNCRDPASAPPHASSAHTPAPPGSGSRPAL